MVTYRDVPAYVDNDFYQAYEWFAFCELMEWPPYEGGWMEWPAVALGVMAAFKLERKTERERHSDDLGTSTPGNSH